MRFSTGPLHDFRKFVADHARAFGLSSQRTDDLVLAANEMATNSVLHGGGSGLARVWGEDETLLCEIRDAGRIDNVMVGRVRPRRDEIGWPRRVDGEPVVRPRAAPIIGDRHGRSSAHARRLDVVASVHMQLAEFQALMDDLYGEGDRARGIPSTVAWLCEEMGELAQAVRKGTRDEQRHELGDVLAWVASLANQLDLSLEDAAQRYVTDPAVLTAAAPIRSRLMAHQVRGVVAKGKGPAGHGRDDRGARSRPGRGVDRRAGVRRVPHRPALPRGRASTTTSRSCSVTRPRAWSKPSAPT